MRLRSSASAAGRQGGFNAACACSPKREGAPCLPALACWAARLQAWDRKQPSIWSPTAALARAGSFCGWLLGSMHASLSIRLARLRSNLHSLGAVTCDLERDAFCQHICLHAICLSAKGLLCFVQTNDTRCGQIVKASKIGHVCTVRLWSQDSNGFAD